MEDITAMIRKYEASDPALHAVEDDIMDGWC
jgi:hypothetical protein